MDEPTWDRWMYPFNLTPGARASAPSFGAIGEDGFDDRDSQFLVGFDTSGDVFPGEGAARYRITAATFVATVSNNNGFAYDDTPDAWQTSLATDDPNFQADSDAGKPIELFGVGYAGGFDATTFTETSPYGTPIMMPAFGGRNAFAANFMSDGTAINVSNNAKDGFDPDRLAVGTAPLSPGALVPADTTFTFMMDTSDPVAMSYLRRSLDTGVVVFSVSSLQAASGGPGGGGGVVYPIWYTRDNIIAIFDGLMPELQLTVFVGSPADLNGDSLFNNTDINAFVAAFLAGEASADINADGILNNTDINAFVTAFLAG